LFSLTFGPGLTFALTFGPGIAAAWGDPAPAAAAGNKSSAAVRIELHEGALADRSVRLRY
jgi:hypothetical protein